ncbi:MAG TPA: hypothetical protein VEA16_10995 [Vicinamibacterales bacterium]|nr:hypothetical protein [Vicinamibacterales bacterium]
MGPLRGRSSASESPYRLPSFLAAEMLNVDLFKGGIGNRRGGSSALSMTFSSGGPFTGTISHLSAHLPTGVPSAGELWAVDDAATPIMGKLAGGTTWAPITLTDNWTSADVEHIDAVTFNGKRFFAGNTAQDRTHVSRDGSTLERMGQGAPAAAPTVANTGAGSYAATTRYYRQREAVLSGSTRLFVSEPSAVVSFTPSGAGAAARITKATAVEDSTHWILEGSADNETFYELATTANGTTTYDDSAAPSTYSSGTESYTAGDYSTWPSVKYLATDGNRLLGAGSWESGFTSRVWFSALLGASGVGNDERLPTDNYVDLNEQDGGVITGICKQSVYGYVWVFKRSQIWRLVSTGIATAPYRPICETREVGAISNKSIIVAEDSAGRPAIYFYSDKGPYRLGVNGVEYLGRDVQDLHDTFNKDASSVAVHGVYYREKHQVWWWIATGSANDPDQRIVFDTELGRVVDEDETRGGWVKHTGENCEARCSVMFASTVGASMSTAQKPYIGQTDAANRVWKCDTGTTDAGTTYRAYVQSLPFRFGNDVQKCQAFPPRIAALAGSTNVTVSYIRDEGDETRSGSVVSFTAVGSETLLRKLIEGLETADADSVAIRIGDASAQDATWTIEQAVIPYELREVAA